MNTGQVSLQNQGLHSLGCKTLSYTWSYLIPQTTCQVCVKVPSETQRDGGNCFVILGLLCPSVKWPGWTRYSLRSCPHLVTSMWNLGVGSLCWSTGKTCTGWWLRAQDHSKLHGMVAWLWFKTHLASSPGLALFQLSGLGQVTLSVWICFLLIHKVGS